MKSPLIISGQRVTFGGRNALGRYQVPQKPPKPQVVVASFKAKPEWHVDHGSDGVDRVWVPNRRGTFTQYSVSEFTWRWMGYQVMAALHQINFSE